MENLEKYRDNEAFQVPDGYFETLQKDVLNRIHHQQKINRRNKLLLTFSSAAASLLIVVALLIFFPKSGDPILVSNFESLSNAQISKQLDDKISDNQDNLQPENVSVQNESNRDAVDAKVKRGRVNNEPEFDNLDYQIVETYSDELVYSDVLEFYSE